MRIHEDEVGERVILGPEFAEALQYTAVLHSDQVRKGGNTPYLGHLLQVAGMVIDEGASRNVAIAALLHDSAEDRGGQERIDDIARKFGPEVAALVLELSDTLEAEKGPWRPRKEAYIEHMKECSEGALLISIADKLHNTSSIVRDWHAVGEEIWQRFAVEKEETLWFYQTLFQAYKTRAKELGLNIYMLRSLERAVEEMKSIVEGREKKMNK